jgi:hypothetical protein
MRECLGCGFMDLGHAGDSCEVQVCCLDLGVIVDFRLSTAAFPVRNGSCLPFMPMCRVKAKNTNPLLAFLASCPDNAFQRVPPGMQPFSLGQRVGAILRNGGKLLGVGFGASMLGEWVSSAGVPALDEDPLSFFCLPGQITLQTQTSTLCRGSSHHASMKQLLTHV